MPSLGVPEFLIAFVVLGWMVVPLAIAVWALVTLSRVRTAVDAMRATLDRVEKTIAQR